MATDKLREDRFSWNEGDVIFSPGFKTKDQLIKEGKLTPDEKIVAETDTTGASKKADT